MRCEGRREKAHHLGKGRHGKASIRKLNSDKQRELICLGFKRRRTGRLCTSKRDTSYLGPGRIEGRPRTLKTSPIGLLGFIYSAQALSIRVGPQHSGPAVSLLKRRLGPQLCGRLGEFQSFVH